MNTSSSLCQWCNQVVIGVQQPGQIFCSKHQICNKCQIKRRISQSSCPICWYENGTILLNHLRYCAVCYNQIQVNNQNYFCDNRHPRCSPCSPSGCVLCRFVQLRSWQNISLDDLPTDIHRTVETCDQLEKKFEEMQQANTNPVLNREDSAVMDVDASLNSTASKTAAAAAAPAATSSKNDCRICLDDLDATQVAMPVCQHVFHRDCVEKWFQSSGKMTCPTCGYLYGICKGPQPQGEMKIKYIPTPLPGFPAEQYPPNEGPTIEITYLIPSGVQGPQNPQPGQPFTGTNRTAYLPNNPEGKYVLQLLQRAFNDQHIFTIGISTTTGRDNVVIWNDIHHKTQITGGPEGYGYPDPTYLTRVRRELADKGYK